MSQGLENVDLLQLGKMFENNLAMLMVQSYTHAYLEVLLSLLKLTSKD